MKLAHATAAMALAAAFISAPAAASDKFELLHDAN